MFSFYVLWLYFYRHSYSRMNFIIVKIKSVENKKSIDAGQLVEVLQKFEQLLLEHRVYIDSLNVFPVPDGDTGANMYLTMKSVGQALAAAPDDAKTFAGIAKVVTQGAVMGARGNSGVLLCQILKGFVDTFSKCDKELDAQAWIDGALAASKYAYEAVSEPVEGTILTVISEIAQGGPAKSQAKNQAKNKKPSLAEVIQNFQEAGAQSLQRTPELLEVLKKAGVVDAGGSGLLLFFDALAFVVLGKQTPPVPVPLQILNSAAATEDVDGTRYEVMFILLATDDKIPAFRNGWEELGDSIVISGGEGVWSCHIHTDEIGKVIEVGIAAGTPQNIRVTDLYLDTNHSDIHLEDLEDAAEFLLLDTQLGDLKIEQVKTHVVVAAQGLGLAKTFSSLGSRAMVVGGQTQNPSAKAFLDAIEQVEAEEIIILPNNSNICAVANSLVAESSKTINVVETKTIPEGLSAMLVYDPAETAKSNAERMERAKKDVVSGQVTQAVRDSKSHGVKQGDFIGLDVSDILISSQSLVSTTCDLLKKLITPAQDLLTLIAGNQATSADSAKITECLKHNYPDLEVELIEGGQDLYHYYIGLE